MPTEEEKEPVLKEQGDGLKPGGEKKTKKVKKEKSVDDVAEVIEGLTYIRGQLRSLRPENNTPESKALVKVCSALKHLEEMK